MLVDRKDSEEKNIYQVDTYLVIQIKRIHTYTHTYTYSLPYIIRNVYVETVVHIREHYALYVSS